MTYLTPDTLFIPSGEEPLQALQKTTHLAIGAHADDLEIFALHGIISALNAKEKSFTGVTITNGAGSPRAGKFAHTTNEEMIAIRKKEQNLAATLGEYGAQIQLGFASADVKQKQYKQLEEVLTEILQITKPEYIYTHNIADKHDTHVAIALRVITIVRQLGLQLKGFYGCEVWRDLDWMQDDAKVVLPCSNHEELALQLCAVHESQIAGGKRYDLAAAGRRRANATFFESKATDKEDAVTFAIDYLPLLHNPRLSVQQLITSHIDAFKNDVLSTIKKFDI